MARNKKEEIKLEFKCDRCGEVSECGELDYSKGKQRFICDNCKDPEVVNMTRAELQEEIKEGCVEAFAEILMFMLENIDLYKKEKEK